MMKKMKPGKGLSALEQLISCQNKSGDEPSYPFVRIIRNDEVDAAGLALKVKKGLHGYGPGQQRPGPKSRTRRACCLCNDTLDKIHSSEAAGMTVTPKMHCLLQELVFTRTFLQQFNLSWKSAQRIELTWICAGCKKVIQRIEKFQQEIQDIEGKIEGIVHCIRAVYKLTMNNKPGKKRGTELETNKEQFLENKKLQMSKPFSNDYEVMEVAVKIEDMPWEDEEQNQQFDYFPEEIELQAVDSNSHDLEHHSKKSNMNKSSSTRPSRRSKFRANQLLQSVCDVEVDPDDASLNKVDENGRMSEDNEEDYEIDPVDSVNMSDDDDTEIGFKPSSTSKSRKRRKSSQSDELYSGESNSEFRTQYNQSDIFSCKICGKTLATKRSLRKHARTVHSKKRCICHFCGKAFAEHRFQFHLNMHNGINVDKRQIDCKCDICGNKFKHTKNLQDHINSVHKGLRPFKCQVCDQRFARRFNLLSHMKKHRTLEEKLKCSTCDETFQKIADRVIHERHAHLDRPVLACSHCDKVYSNSWDFKKHLYKHTGIIQIKQYSCDKCQKKFTNNANRMAHAETKCGNTNGQDFACLKCPSKFFTVHKLSLHMGSAHIDDEGADGRQNGGNDFNRNESIHDKDVNTSSTSEKSSQSQQESQVSSFPITVEFETEVE